MFANAKVKCRKQLMEIDGWHCRLYLFSQKTKCLRNVLNVCQCIIRTIAIFQLLRLWDARNGTRATTKSDSFLYSFHLVFMQFSYIVVDKNNTPRDRFESNEREEEKKNANEKRYFWHSVKDVFIWQPILRWNSKLTETMEWIFSVFNLFSILLMKNNVKCIQILHEATRKTTKLLKSIHLFDGKRATVTASHWQMVGQRHQRKQRKIKLWIIKRQSAKIHDMWYLCVRPRSSIQDRSDHSFENFIQFFFLYVCSFTSPNARVFFE